MAEQGRFTGGKEERLARLVIDMLEDARKTIPEEADMDSHDWRWKTKDTSRPYPEFFYQNRGDTPIISYMFSNLGEVVRTIGDEPDDDRAYGLRLDDEGLKVIFDQVTTLADQEARERIPFASSHEVKELLEKILKTHQER